MERLQRRGADLGLSPSDVENALITGPGHELAWVVGSRAQSAERNPWGSSWQVRRQNSRRPAAQERKKEGRRGEEGEAQESSQLSSAEESESSSFQLTPAVEDRPQEARAVDSPGTGRHDALSIADNIKVELGTLDLKWEGQRVTAFF